MRIKIKSDDYRGEKRSKELKQNSVQTKRELRVLVEQEILQRLDAIRRYLMDSDHDIYLSHEKIFQEYQG